MPKKGQNKLTPGEFAAAVDRIIENHKAGGELPTDYMLMCETGLCSRTLDRIYAAADGTGHGANYENENPANMNNNPLDNNKPKEDNIYNNSEIEIDNNNSYVAAIKKLVAYRQHLCSQGMLGHNAAGYIFLSKQGRYGKYTDRAETVQAGGMDIAVKLDFSGGNQGEKIG